ncbi:hypothetical protein ADUPG1_013072 [Aduncisulcus paluster]|uniref:RING-type domain-containing protein n=1 Tax=Aduncisulcus paluster TaxID=2918883 RepID=A0ABQ5K281_9EUKA|nr:hypothetical protein ADUPG1_013072 [Aduncisulcus paluster]|eukprot:gnl/Carplike_NY0171/4600_a6251_349.p1 GENE.gnl/Carplike_NY0171/4600_a6251_349~~gnl/Carplike_NY0171/4600_a6251_349.p1  ORF type:complete len:299 (-),score=52.05 gnl/Carplike_NY0171/4600_a6251_349:96-992(-)
MGNGSSSLGQAETFQTPSYLQNRLASGGHPIHTNPSMIVDPDVRISLLAEQGYDPGSVWTGERISERIQVDKAEIAALRVPVVIADKSLIFTHCTDGVRVSFKYGSCVPLKIMILVGYKKIAGRAAAMAHSGPYDLPPTSPSPGDAAKASQHRLFQQTDSFDSTLLFETLAPYCTDADAPMAIQIEDATKPSVGFQSLTLFINIDRQMPLISKRKLKVTDKAYEMEEMFGVDGSISECVICMTNVPDCAFIPCRHKCVCAECMEEFRKRGNMKCPVCRSVVTRIMHLTDVGGPMEEGI